MYHHVQKSPLHLLLYVLALFVFFIAWEAPAFTTPGILLAIVAILLTVFALSFQTLTVSDGGDHLDIRYGPLNLFGTTIPYDEISSVEPGDTSWIDGWGIHFIPLRGWTFNLWGFECVNILLGERVTRIGTDDSEELVRFLKERVGID